MLTYADEVVVYPPHDSHPDVLAGIYMSANLSGYSQAYEYLLKSMLCT